MSRYLVIIEKTDTGFSAYSPDLPGCVATGASRKEVEREMHDAIEFHIEGLRLAGEAVPYRLPRHPRPGNSMTRGQWPKPCPAAGEAAAALVARNKRLPRRAVKL